MTKKNYSACEDDLVEAVNALDSAGANFAIIATNTLHYFYKPVSSRVNIPIISLVDTVRDYAQKHNLKKLILLGTKFTMTKPFYSEALAKAGIETLVPEPDAQDFLHKSIFEELTRGIIKDDTKNRYIKIVEELIARGADGVILGCTEIPLLIKQDDVRIHVVDSSEIHAEAALKYALE
jgi:aspartate racemase